MLSSHHPAPPSVLWSSFDLSRANFSQDELDALNANGLFGNNPIDSNDSPPGNNQQSCSVTGWPTGCILSNGTAAGGTALY